MNIAKFSGSCFIFVSMFPWVSFGLNSGDSQPWPILLSLIFIFLFCLVNPVQKRLIWPFSIIPIFFLVYLFSGPQLNELVIRAFAQYIGFSLVLVASFFYVKKYGVPVSIIVLSNFIYISASVLQLIFGGSIFEAIVNVRTSDDRGVTSLTAEPTYFGLVLFFLTWIYFVVYGFRCARLNALMAVNIVFILLVAKSSMILLFLVVAIILYVFSYVKLRSMLLLGGVILISYFAFVNFLDGSRIFKFAAVLFDGGVWSFFYSDASANARLASIVLPIYGFFDNLFMPAGFLTYFNNSLDYADKFNGFFWYGYQTDKIMSFIGSFVYELGFFGFLYIFFMILMMRLKRKEIRSLLLFFVVLLSAIPIGFSIIPIFVSIYCYGNRLGYSDCARLG